MSSGYQRSKSAPSSKKEYKKNALKIVTKPKNESDVVKLQHQVNKITRKMTNEVEIKQVDFGVFQYSVGQVQGKGLTNPAVSGHAFFQLPINISQGAKAVERVGNFINLKSMLWRMQIQGQLNTVSHMKFKMEIYQVKGDPNTLPLGITLLQFMKDPNYFVKANTGTFSQGALDLYDTTSQINSNCVKSQFARKVCTKYFSLPQRAFAGGATAPPNPIREFNFRLNLKDERIGFQPGSVNQLQTAYYCYIYANTGNCGAADVPLDYQMSAAPQSGLGQTTINSGARIYANVRLEYTDQ